MGPCAKFIVKEPLRALNKALLPLQSPYDAAAAVCFFLERQPFHEPVELVLLTVLSMTRPPWPVSDSAAGKLEERALQSASDFIEEVSGRLQTLGYQAKGTAVLGKPVDTILKEAEKVRPDLILAGSHGRAGVTRFVLGSVSHALLHQAHCPVLVFQ